MNGTYHREKERKLRLHADSEAGFRGFLNDRVTLGIYENDGVCRAPRPRQAAVHFYKMPLGAITGVGIQTQISAMAVMLS